MRACHACPQPQPRYLSPGPFSRKPAPLPSGLEHCTFRPQLLTQRRARRARSSPGSPAAERRARRQQAEGGSEGGGSYVGGGAGSSSAASTARGRAPHAWRHPPPGPVDGGGDVQGLGTAVSGAWPAGGDVGQEDEEEDQAFDVDVAFESALRARTPSWVLRAARAVQQGSSPARGARARRGSAPPTPAAPAQPQQRRGASPAAAGKQLSHPSSASQQPAAAAPANGPPRSEAGRAGARPQSAPGVRHGADGRGHPATQQQQKHRRHAGAGVPQPGQRPAPAQRAHPPPAGSVGSSAADFVEFIARQCQHVLAAQRRKAEAAQQAEREAARGARRRRALSPGTQRILERKLQVRHVSSGRGYELARRGRVAALITTDPWARGH